jgi:hypothetical protein
MYVLYIVVCPFVLFLLAIVFSVLLRYMDSDWYLQTRPIIFNIKSDELKINLVWSYLHFTCSIDDFNFSMFNIFPCKISSENSFLLLVVYVDMLFCV